MVLSMRSETVQNEASDEADREVVTISTLLSPPNYQPATSEQARDFELIRLAFFVIKLRKLKLSRIRDTHYIDTSKYDLQCSLLQHVIFQQILYLTRLDARQQALQIVATDVPSKFGHNRQPQAPGTRPQYFSMNEPP